MCAPCGLERAGLKPPRGETRKPVGPSHPVSKKYCIVAGRGSGSRSHPLYCTWNGMIQRCHNPRNTSYDRYGARGITVCPEWLASLERFAADMGPRPEGHTIDRIDNDKGYSPDNCRWASRWEQGQNRHDVPRFPYRGELRTASEIRKLTGTKIAQTTFWARLANGWDPDEAAVAPIDERFSRRNRKGAA